MISYAVFCLKKKTGVEIPEAFVEFRAWEAQSLRLSQNWRLIAARETVVEFMVGIIAERETVVELTVRAVAEPETFVNLKKKRKKSWGRTP